MSSITDYLEADSSWQALVGDRLFPVQVDQGAQSPFCRFRLEKEEREYSLFNSDPVDHLKAEIVWTILSDDYMEAHQAREILCSRLDGASGTIGDIDVITIRVLDSRDGETLDEVLGLYSVICETSVWFNHA